MKKQSQFIQIALYISYLFTTDITCITCKVGLNIKKDPLLVVALMIKNEGPVIDNTLAPMVEGGIDSFLIFDTGSTDDTVEKVTQFFNNHNITNFIIEQEDFVDFSTSRNRALDLVDVHFPEATFILMPDAEWFLRGGQELLNFCRDNKNGLHASYHLRLVHNHSVEFSVMRLMRRASHCRFKSPIHEYLVSPSSLGTPSTIYFELNNTQYGSEKSRKRWERDVRILLKAYAENPTEPRTIFYLAQTFACLGERDNALRFYELRTQTPSWAEEDYEAMYRLAGTINEVARLDTKQEKHYDWSLAMQCYLKAFAMRPTRIEPLMQIAHHFLANNDYANAFLFAQHACEIPYPSNDLLFVEKEAYLYGRYDIMAQCGLKIGEYEKGRWALNKALDYKPNDNHLQELQAEYLKL